MDRCSVWRGISIEAGALADYEGLAEFHYRGGRPGGVKRVWVAWFEGHGDAETQGRGEGNGCTDFSPCHRVAALPRRIRAGMLVECLPALGCTLRNVALAGRYEGMEGGRSLAAAKLNAEVRTIARVVVHPMFRATGLAAELVRHALENAETPFVEALAAMGRANRFFERAGMRMYERPMDEAGVRLVAALAAENSKLKTLNANDGKWSVVGGQWSEGENSKLKTLKAKLEGDAESGMRNDAVGPMLGVGGGKWEDVSARTGGTGLSADKPVAPRERGTGNLPLETFATIISYLAGLRVVDVSPFLAGELKRFARKKEGGVEDWLAEARGRLFSWPVYFLWKKGAGEG